MPFKSPCWRKFAQLMSHHILGNKNLMKYFAVVDHKGKAHEFGNYGASSCPGFYRLTRAVTNLPVDLDKQLLINIRPLFKRSSHISYLVFRISPQEIRISVLQDQLSFPFTLASSDNPFVTRISGISCLSTFCQHARRRTGMPPAGSMALSTT